MSKSVIRDLIFRIEGYGDEPDYEIESIVTRSDGRIAVVICPASRTQDDTENGGQAEQEAAE